MWQRIEIDGKQHWVRRVDALPDEPTPGAVLILHHEGEVLRYEPDTLTWLVLGKAPEMKEPHLKEAWRNPQLTASDTLDWSTT